MIVVADTGPLHYLILLDRVELLHRFYGEVVVPDAVAIELSSPSAPSPVRDWIARAPPWLSVVPVESDNVQAITDDLDLGERAAIALAVTMHTDLLLIDDAAGRAEARRRKLRVTGMLGVLRAAAELGSTISKTLALPKPFNDFALLLDELSDLRKPIAQIAERCGGRHSVRQVCPRYALASIGPTLPFGHTRKSRRTLAA
jgi:predicted nucleic acid-binding protein